MEVIIIKETDNVIEETITNTDITINNSPTTLSITEKETEILEVVKTESVLVKEKIIEVVSIEKEPLVIEVAKVGPQGPRGLPALTGASITSDDGSVNILIDEANYDLSVNHNEVNGLQGGTDGEYYHLNANQYGDYIGRTEVATISSGINSRIDALEENPIPDIFRSEIESISASFDTRIDALEENPIPDIFRSEIESISASFDTRIDALEENPVADIFRTEVVAVSAGLDNRLDILEADPITATEVASVSAGLDSRIDALELMPSPDIYRAEVASISAALDIRLDVLENDPITASEVASISAGLDSRIDALEANPIPDIFRSEIEDISAGLDSRIDVLETEIDNKVSKSGDIMTGALQMSGAAIQLDSDYTPSHSEGTIFYDTDSHTLSYYNDISDVTINVGQEEVIRVRNNTGSTILNGTLVYVSGAAGNLPTIIKANNSLEDTAHNIIGMTTHDIESVGTPGYVTVSGVVNGLNTNSFDEGDVLWLGTNGGYTTTKPTFPNHAVKIGYVIRSHPTHGSILVHIESEGDFRNLDDVVIGDSSEGDILTIGSSGEITNEYNIHDYITAVEVASISSGINDRIEPLEDFVENYSVPPHNNLPSLQGGDTDEYYHLSQMQYEDYIGKSEVASISSNLQTQINLKANDASVVHITGNETISGVKTFSSETVFNNNVYINGTQFVVDTENVSASDNIITINAGEVGPGVTAGIAGIEVDRGSLPKYQFLFRESDNAFVVGEVGDLVPLAGREDTPINNGFAKWNSTENIFETTLDVASKTEVASISSGLDGRLDSVEAFVSGYEVPPHNNLPGLQGGELDEYYHLSASQYSDYIGRSEVASISGNLQTQINLKLNSSSYTASDVLSKLLTVDGAGSGLDADLLDGQQGSYYAPASSIPTSASFLTDYDNRYVNISGDTMTGSITFGGSGVKGLQRNVDDSGLFLSGGSGANIGANIELYGPSTAGISGWAVIDANSTRIRTLDGGTTIAIFSNANGLELGKTSGEAIKVGNGTSTSTATPVSVDLGGTYSSTAGINPKLALFDNGVSIQYGFGVSANQLDYIITPAGTDHAFWVGGSKVAEIGSNGIVMPTGTSVKAPSFHTRQLFTIADDAVVGFTVPNAGLLMIACSTDKDYSCVVTFRAITTAFCSALSQLVMGDPVVMSDIDFTTGILTGGSGTDGRLTISAHTNNTVYISNRSGATQGFSVMVMG